MKMPPKKDMDDMMDKPKAKKKGGPKGKGKKKK